MISGTAGRRRHARHRWRPRFLVAVVVVVILLAALAIRMATVSGAPLRVTRVLPASVNMPGTPPQLAWPANGEAAIAVEGTGTIGVSGGDTPVPIASVAKVMTAYQVLQDHPLPPGANGFSVTMTQADVAAEQLLARASQTVLTVTAGEVLNQRQLLEALLIPSANNIAAILARTDAGSTAAFVTKMNATARALGMNHTTYTDPSGVATTTVSTPSDQLRLAGAAMAIPTFAQIVAMPSASFPGAGTLQNFNPLVGNNGFVGIKSGSDSEAGGCLLFANRQTIDNQPVTFLGVVLGQMRGQMSTSVLLGAASNAAKALTLSAIAAVSVKTVVAAHTQVFRLTNGDGAAVPVVTTQPVTAIGWGARPVPVRLDIPARRWRTVRSGQVAGQVTAAGGEVSSSPAVTTSSTPGPSLGWRLLHVF